MCFRLKDPAEANEDEETLQDELEEEEAEEKVEEKPEEETEESDSEVNFKTPKRANCGRAEEEEVDTPALDVQRLRPARLLTPSDDTPDRR